MLFESVSVFFCAQSSYSNPLDMSSSYDGGYPHRYNEATLTSTIITSTDPIPIPVPIHNNTPAIVGGVVGGIAVLALGGLGVFFMMRRRNRTSTEGGGGTGKNNGIVPGIPVMEENPGASVVMPGGGGGGGNQPMYNPAHSTQGQPQPQQSGIYGYPPDKGGPDGTYGHHQGAAPAYPGSPVSALTEPNRMSMMAPASPSTMQGGSPFQFAHPRDSSVSGASMYGGVPPTVVEAGGEAVNPLGVPGGHVNHRGEFHEMSS